MGPPPELEIPEHVHRGTECVHYRNHRINWKYDPAKDKKSPNALML